MPDSSASPLKPIRADDIVVQSDSIVVFRSWVSLSLKQQGFRATLKDLTKQKIPLPEMMTIHGGVIEKSASGKYDAAIETDRGPVVLQGATRTDDQSVDLQLIQRMESGPDATTDYGTYMPDQLLRELANTPKPSAALICAIELTRFKSSLNAVLPGLLWTYISQHRNSNNRDELVAVGAAIRKYIAVIPMKQMGGLASLLEAGHRSPISIDLEIEIAKMIYRNFEVRPPVAPDPHPELAERLWEMVELYINPRILLRDKHSAAVSVAIEAIVSMRSSLAQQALEAVVNSPYRWLAELVEDELKELHEIWSAENAEAAAWLNEILGLGASSMTAGSALSAKLPHV